MPKVSRKDYRKPEYQIPHTYLLINHFDQGTVVQSKLTVRREPGADKDIPLSLKKEELDVIGIKINNEPAAPNQITIKDDEVLFHGLPDNCEISVHQTIMKPSENKTASGMYESNGNIYTQFEPEADRRFYLSPSRPDMPTEFTIKIVADKNKYPTLLANPHLIEKGEVENDPTRHYALFHCPNKISTYLSCIIMGNLDYREIKTKKPNGEDITIRAYAPKGYAQYTDVALQAPQIFWDWQKKTYGFDYSLGEYNMVFIPDYAAGAMENEGLNTFNSCCLLPKKLATDAGYIYCFGTIFHELTHAELGNDVPIEQWLDLALKEGLTTSMEHESTGQYLGSDHYRITNIDYLMSKQYAEDASKLAHPVRNESYEDIGNYYTTTTYRKGAQLWHTLHQMIGDDLWCRGIKTYVARYSGKPASIQTLIDVMQEVSGQNLVQFTRWFDQAGTPHIDIEDDYDQATQTYHLTLKQSCPQQEGQPEKLPFHIPVKLGLLDLQGNELPVDEAGNGSVTLHLTEPSQTFSFKCDSKPIPSVFRGFSAPVKIQSSPLSFADHCHLLAHDKDNISRWMSAQHLKKQAIKMLLEGNKDIPMIFFASLKEVLQNQQITKDVRATLIEAPTMSALMTDFTGADPLKLLEARTTLQITIALFLEDDLVETYNECYRREPYVFTPEKFANRTLYNAALQLLCSLGSSQAIQTAHQQYKNSDVLNDKEAALQALFRTGEADQYLSVFLSEHEEGLERELATDHWIEYMVANEKDISFSSLDKMTSSPGFIWERPNHVKELYRGLARNIKLFHHNSGAGYQYFADIVLKLNKINDTMSSDAVRSLTSYDKLDPHHARLMLEALRKIAQAGNISEQLGELVQKSLPAGEKVLRAEPALSVVSYDLPGSSPESRSPLKRARDEDDQDQAVGVKRGVGVI